MSKVLSYALEDLGLASNMDAEGRHWKFMGILAGNRYEWAITYIAMMHQKMTTIPLYETLGFDALKFVLNQTELTTICTSEKNALKLLKMKMEDTT